MGVSSKAFSRNSLSLVLLSFAIDDFVATFLTGLFVGVGFGFAFVFAFGFAPTLLFPAAVLGPGLFAVAALVVVVFGAAFVVRFAGVRPVCALGLPTGLEVDVAYDRVPKVRTHPCGSVVYKELISLLSSKLWLTRASHGL